MHFFFCILFSHPYIVSLELYLTRLSYRPSQYPHSNLSFPHHSSPPLFSFPLMDYLSLKLLFRRRISPPIFRPRFHLCTSARPLLPPAYLCLDALFLFAFRFFTGTCFSFRPSRPSSSSLLLLLSWAYSLPLYLNLALPLPGLLSPSSLLRPFHSPCFRPIDVLSPVHFYVCISYTRCWFH